MAPSPSETSPLLPKDQSTPEERSVLTEPDGGIAPDGPHLSPTVSRQDGDERDVEGQQSPSPDQEAAKTYEGMPEVRKRMKYIFPALGIGVFLSAADQTIVVSSYSAIGSELNALNRTSWIAAAYLLTLTSFQPLYGKLSDIFGRKACLLFGISVFGLGCLFCGLAQNMNQLIAARAFAGIGGGGMTTVVSILLSDVVSLRERGKWQGYINIIYATGGSCGAPLGGIFADVIGWRWAFLLQTPLCVVAFVAILFVLRLPKKDDSNWKAKIKRVDFPGALLLIAAVFCLLLALDRGSNVSWSSKIAIVGLIVAAVLVALFLTVETKFAVEPFAPGRVIFSRSFFACYLCNFFSFGGWFAAIFSIPLFFQAVDGLSASQAGFRLIPSLIAGVSGSLAAGFYMQKTGKYFWLNLSCYLSLTCGLIVILLCSGLVSDSQVGFIIGMCICAFSNGIGVTTSLIALISNASREDQAVATACSYLFRSLGSTFGLSMASTVANQVMRTSLASELGPGEETEKIALKVRQSLKFLKTLDPDIQAAVVRCFAYASRASFTFESAVVFGAFISAWFIIEKPLGKK